MTVTVPHYITTDGLGRWTGTGAALSAAYLDANFYTLQAAINGLSLTPGVGVAAISQPTAGTLLFTMTDATTQGPFSLPVGGFNFRGAWAASTAYAVNDAFYSSGVVYAVIFAHTSATTFASGANDGAGHNYYSVMFPSLALTAGANITITGTWPNLTIASANAPLVASALSATTGTVSVDFSTRDIATVTPTGDITLNASAPLAKKVSLIVTTSGTTSYTITFGTNFKASGTLATGTVTAKDFIVEFTGDGVVFREFARSAAL
jgi:hypothetical protein